MSRSGHRHQVRGTNEVHLLYTTRVGLRTYDAPANNLTLRAAAMYVGFVAFYLFLKFKLRRATLLSVSFKALVPE